MVDFTEQEKTLLGKILSKKYQGVDWVLKNKATSNKENLVRYNEQIEDLCNKIGCVLEKERPVWDKRKKNDPQQTLPTGDEV